MSTPVGIVGFRGYSGAELVRLLNGHPQIEPVLMEHRADSSGDVAPRGARRSRQIPATADAAKEAGLAAVLLATPHEVSIELAPELLDAGCKVVDLSGGFRLQTNEKHQRWYKETHPHPDLLSEAAYGLPEFYRDRIRDARLVANPGCYPTAANLALRPLVQAGVVDLESGIVCDAKSGVSGAGRKPNLKTSFCEVADNFSAYAVLDHRHVPEVLLHSMLDASNFCFTAQLLPLDRGILETIYVRLVESLGPSDLLTLYEQAYSREPFVRLYDPGKFPDLRAVRLTNYCDIGFTIHAESKMVCIVSAIDNLLKGAAGQAVQNLNLILGFPEAQGLA